MTKGSRSRVELAVMMLEGVVVLWGMGNGGLNPGLLLCCPRAAIFAILAAIGATVLRSDRKFVGQNLKKPLKPPAEVLAEVAARPKCRPSLVVLRGLCIDGLGCLVECTVNASGPLPPISSFMVACCTPSHPVAST
jgi:hypothetical protein